MSAIGNISAEIRIRILKGSAEIVDTQNCILTDIDQRNIVSLFGVVSLDVEIVKVQMNAGVETMFLEFETSIAIPKVEFRIQ